MPLISPDLNIDDKFIDSWESIFKCPYVQDEVIEVIKPGFVCTSIPDIFFPDSDNFFYGIPGTRFRTLRKKTQRRYKRLVKKNKEDQFYQKLEMLFTAFPAYGITDSPEYFINAYSYCLASTHVNICVVFKYAGKPKDANVGWRWHKNGPYLGKQGVPQYEYFADEEGFENGVWFFHIYEVKPKE
jgi:hypothetical protein